MVHHEHLVKNQPDHLKVAHNHNSHCEQNSKDAIIWSTLLNNHILLPLFRQVHQKPVERPRNIHDINYQNRVVDWGVIICPYLIFTVPCFDMVSKHDVMVFGLKRRINRNEHCQRTEKHVEHKPVLNLCRTFFTSKPLLISVWVLVMISTFFEGSKKRHVDHDDGVESVMKNIVVLNHLVPA